jgi:predicted butyrate kinase (DUF1464 family)
VGLAVRVAGTDPGTSSLDVVVLTDGAVGEQRRFSPVEVRSDPAAPVRWLEERGPLMLVAGPSGYGLPLVRSEAVTERDLDLMSLVRPDERDQAQGVAGFAALVRAFASKSLPVVFLPGVVHLATVPAHRKLNRIDLGTADKLCVAALALAQRPDGWSGCVVELGSAFTACVVAAGGRIVDGVGGTGGPIGWASGGGWDGEAAYLLSPLTKGDLFGGGAAALGETGRARFREGVVKTVAGLRAATPFDEVLLSGRLLETEPSLAEAVEAGLRRFVGVGRLASLPGAWVKQAAQGAALLADGLAGGRWAPLVERLRLREAAGTVMDHLTQPRADEVRAAFGLGACGRGG